MNKRHEIELIHSTFNKIPDAEPIFILRAQDECAPYAIKAWANRVEQEWQDAIGWKRGVASEIPANVQAKLTEARATADAMEAWGNRKLPD